MATEVAKTVTGDMFRRKKVKEKRPSPFLYSNPQTPKGGFIRVIISGDNNFSEEFVVFFVNAV